MNRRDFLIGGVSGLAVGAGLVKATNHFEHVQAKIIPATNATAAAPMPIKTAFEYVYKKGTWGFNTDGSGSSGPATELGLQQYGSFLNYLLKSANIKSVVDAGCGEAGFKYSDWAGIDYKGYDIVAEVIDRDKKYEKPNINFFVANIVDYDLPQADLLICKHVLQHLPNADVAKFLTKQIPKYRHVIIVNSVDRITFTAVNRDINPGDFRPLDITKPPFSAQGVKILTYFDDPYMQQIVYLAGHS
jgi:SAM-dependent methyltransferase